MGCMYAMYINNSILNETDDLIRDTLLLRLQEASAMIALVLILMSSPCWISDTFTIAQTLISRFMIS